MSRKMDVSAESHLRPTNPSAVSSTSGEGEREGGAVYALSPRRKTRRKTIVTNDISRLTGQGVHSESALGSPSPPILHLPMLQTSFPTTIEYPMNGETISKGSTSPKRTSGRRSPTKGHLPNVLAGHNVVSDAIKTHGIPRTLTLPTHLTDTLMKMKISNDHTSVESLTQGSSKSKNKAKDNKNDGMEVDEAPTETGAAGNVGSGRKQRTRKRARSLPPRPVITSQDDDECDADDEGGGPDGGNDEGGLMSPTVPIVTTRRGRVAVGEEDEMEMQGMAMTGAAVHTATGVPRRSARRLTVGSNVGHRTLAERLGVVISPVEENMPRKRARTREGREGSSALGEEEDGRSRKKTRKR